jgi:MYXO-CTERM domain-containing protein
MISLQRKAHIDGDHPRTPSVPRSTARAWTGLAGILALAAGGCGAESNSTANEPVGSIASKATGGLAWSHTPPGGLDPKNIPQLVSITFDDNFGLADPASVGGVNDINTFYKGKNNPAGAGNADDFDGKPIGATFYYTTIYLSDSSETVIGGKPGEDSMGRNRAAWSTAFENGHEAADHTVNHFNGGVVNIDPDDCCKPRNWSVADWTAEIKAAKDKLIDPTTGVGAKATDVIGFRTPFLGYNDNVFKSLTDQGFAYDTTIPNCFADDEDATKCSWPHTLDNGSPDADVLAQKFTSDTNSGADFQPPWTFPKVMSHPGLWELPPTTLVVPPDTEAATYKFTAGLRARVLSNAGVARLPYPSIYEKSTGKLAGLDYSILIDAQLTPAEMTAILEYNLDQHIAGNRSPIVFIAHSHLYAYSSPDDNPDTPSKAIRDARWKGLTDFITYALTKPEVRIVPAKDILAWVEKAAANTTAPDGGTVTPGEGGTAGGTPGDDSGGGGTGGTTGSGGSSGSAGTAGSSGSATGGSAGAGDSGSDSGCGCRVGGTRPFTASSALALLAGAALVARRRRRS